MVATIGTMLGHIAEGAQALALGVARPLGRRGLALLLSEVDLTALVRDNLDLDALMATVDLDALAQRIDITDIANRVVQTVDLAGIIREATESVSSGAIRDVRLRGAEADVAVNRTVDRLLRRRPDPVG
jgi:hypothetical protein